ncbi:hypothetical protein ARMGADRAFT_1024145 [Armillaria gallica]|uniref:Uncharacterized protein n=1 Tax=Armillaria gallica TaxID=47427 RepID=A0A2H3DXZ6_ARMGA|nr:hypothetical protein ARMGADRAFT_1024145 [Armillaria gallica]
MTEPTLTRAVDNTILDYSRPTGPPTAGEEWHDPHHQDKLLQKKDKKQHGCLKNEKKIREVVHHKVEANQPMRDVQPEHKGFRAGGRITQPKGRTINLENSMSVCGGSTSNIDWWWRRNKGKKEI